MRTGVQRHMPGPQVRPLHATRHRHPLQGNAYRALASHWTHRIAGPRAVLRGPGSGVFRFSGTTGWGCKGKDRPEAAN